MRVLVFISLFSAAAVALGLILLPIPNLELVTSTFYLSGYFLGARNGVVAAVIGELLYSLLNPLGTATPPLLAAQILGMALAACAGALTEKYEKHRRMTSDLPYCFRRIFLYSLCGFSITIIFDLLTTLSFLLFAGLSGAKLLASLVYGLYFYLTHILLNTLIFALVLPGTIEFLRQKLPALTMP